MNRANLFRASLVMVVTLAAACGQEVPVEEQASHLASREDAVVFSSNQALILGSTVSGGANSPEAVAAQKFGYTPRVVSDAQWAGMTAAQFATYRIIILGDKACASENAMAAAVANRAVWGPVVNGNILIAGTAPVANGATLVTERAIRFAAYAPGKTGLYVSLSCYYQNAAPDTHVALLEPFGDFKVQGGGCHSTAHIVGSHPALDVLSDDHMSHWPSCSVSTSFTSFPIANFTPWSVAMYPPPGEMGTMGVGVQEYVDGSFGAPYILARGATLMGCGDEQLQVGEECDFGYEANGQFGVQCSATCRLNWCGDGIVSAGEHCDPYAAGNTEACPRSCRRMNGNPPPPPPPPANLPPVAACKHLTLNTPADACGASGSVDNGSYDPEGGPVSCTQSSNAFGVGNQSVTLTCVDAQGLSASCNASVNVVDTIAPRITCPASSTFECGVGTASPESNPATATDNCGAPYVTYTMEGEAFSLGSARSVRWIADDGSHEASCTSAVTMVDTLAPSLSLNGPARLRLECNVDSYSEQRAFSHDACAGSLSDRVAISSTVNTAARGLYSVNYRVTDPSGHSAQANREVEVVDTRAPALALNGAASMALECGVDSYTEPRAVASDVCAGDLSGAVAISGTVNTAARGLYAVSYRVADGAGNVATATRNVTVADTKAPALALNGSSMVALECGVDSYTELRAVASDVCTGDLSGAVAISGTVNEAVRGSYPVTYRVTDASGNAASVTRNVSVNDTLAPSIALNGAGTVALECGVDSYTELRAVASDVCAGDLTGSIVTTGAVNAAAVGNYPVRYTVKDGAGNAASAARSVSVSDTLAPSIALKGAASMKLPVGSTFMDPGATATDACSGNLTGAIIKSGTVNTAAPGLYTLTYSVQDAMGLSASVTRNVTVEQAQSCTAVSVKSPREIWPPNHKMWSFNLSECAVVQNPCGGPVDIDAVGTITSIYSDELEDAQGNGDGRTVEDIVITGNSSFQLRAERQGKGNGRVYGVNFKVTDSSGAEQTASCKFIVPHDQSGRGALDDGASAGYTVFAPSQLAGR
ncbi:MAG TPA: DUF5011 domain-containing protein [Myxococcaceae bacterium]|nr:DUF5011 domain-containing protein [Myxococcaceae bacterium]